MTYKVIVVDDEKTTRDIISGYILKKQMGFEIVGSFDDAESAFEYVKKHHVDVVITDIKMPNVSGLELIKRISEIIPDIHFIILSGYSNFEYAQCAIEYKVEKYILKPVNIEELFKTLESVKEKLDSKYEHFYVEKRYMEKMEQFFSDLMMGVFKNEDTMKEEFLRLRIPVDYEKSQGYVFVIRINNVEEYILNNWKYARESLFVAFSNVFKRSFNSKQVYVITNEKNDFVFFCFTKEKFEEVPDMKVQFAEILSLEISVSNMAYFEKLTDIPNITSKNGEIDNLFGIDMKKFIEKFHISDDDEVIKKAVEYLDKNYFEDITRSEVAKVVCLDSAYFSKYFKRKTGVNFYDYFLYVRITKAIELMKNGYNISQISNMVGYSNIRYFEQKFKKFTSYSPKEYKKKYIDAREG